MLGGALEPAELANAIVDLFSDRQAEDIVMVDISRLVTFADYFVIASGQTVRHMDALSDALDTELGKQGIHPQRREGTAESGWVLLDFGSVIVHIFSPSQRAHYNLEGLWGRAASVVRIQ